MIWPLSLDWTPGALESIFSYRFVWVESMTVSSCIHRKLLPGPASIRGSSVGAYVSAVVQCGNGDTGSSGPGRCPFMAGS